MTTERKRVPVVSPSERFKQFLAKENADTKPLEELLSKEIDDDELKRICQVAVHLENQEKLSYNQYYAFAFANVLTKIKKADILPPENSLSEMLQNLLKVEDKKEETLNYPEFFPFSNLLENRMYDDDSDEERKKILEILAPLKRRFENNAPPLSKRELYILVSTLYALNPDEDNLLFYEKAASRNDPFAQTVLGDKYFKKDEKQASDYYLKAVQQDFPEAITKLGMIHITPDDDYYDTAFLYFKRASDLESRSAPAILGYHYLTGTAGLPEDEEKAIHFLSLAEQRGSHLALFHLGELNERKGKSLSAAHYHREAIIKNFSISQAHHTLSNIEELWQENKKNPAMFYLKNSALLLLNKDVSFNIFYPFNNKDDIFILPLFLEDIQCPSRKKRRVAYDLMERVINKYGTGHSPARHQICAFIALKHLREHSTKAFDFIFKLNPEHLTAKQNFELGLHLFLIRQPLPETLKNIPEHVQEQQELFKKLREKIPTSFFEKDKKASDLTYHFLQTSAERGNEDARRLLLSTIASRWLERNPGKVSWHQYIGNDDLFQAKTFQEFTQAFFKLMNEEKKQEQKSVRTVSPFWEQKELRELTEKEKHIEGIIARLRSISRDLEDKFYKFDKFKEWLYPSLDKDLNKEYLDKLEKEISRILELPGIQNNEKIKSALEEMQLVIRNMDDLESDMKNFLS